VQGATASPNVITQPDQVKEPTTSMTSGAAKAETNDAVAWANDAQAQADTEAKVKAEQDAIKSQIEIQQAEAEAQIRAEYGTKQQTLTEQQKQEMATQNALEYKLGRTGTIFGQGEVSQLTDTQTRQMNELNSQMMSSINAAKNAIAQDDWKAYNEQKQAYNDAFNQKLQLSQEARAQQTSDLARVASQNATQKQQADTYASALLSTDETGNVVMPDNDTIQQISDKTGIPVANLVSSLRAKSAEMSKAQTDALPDIINEFQQMKKLGYTTATTPLEYQQEKAMTQKGVVKGSITTGGVGSGVSSGSGGISSINSGIINGQPIVISNDAKNWAKQILDGKASLSNVIGKNNTETSRLRSEVVAAMSAGGNISQASAETTAALHDKVTQIDDLISKTDTVGSGVIGPTWLTRWSPVSTLTGSKAAFVGSVHQLISKETLDSLINLKKSGGTLGALSDQERVMLQNAATKIGSWEIKDDNGYGTGVWAVSESEFKKELQNIKTVAERAIKNAGGGTGVVNTLEQTLSAHPEKIDEFNTLVADNPGMSDDDVIQALGF
jgi:hypothetical protein